MGITAHWIESHAKSPTIWTLVSEVIAFRAISGPHTGANLGRYFVSLCERAGIVAGQTSKVCTMFFLFENRSTHPCQLFCITADNTSNNDTACNEIENIFHRKHIYSFDSDTQRLPCLAHVVNLAITDFMSAVTNIVSVETTSAIWEFDPSLPRNRVLDGESLDVVSAVRTLAIKIQASGQRIAYFERLQIECGITVPLSIPLHSNVRWGTADGMLGRAYRLRQPINLFINSADELFGPITTIRRPGLPAKQIPWTAFSFKAADWDRVNDIRTIIADANNIQQYFSHELQPTLWRAIPTFEELQTGWETKRNSPRYVLYKDAINRGLSKIGKYYSKFDEKPAYILALGMSFLPI